MIRLNSSLIIFVSLFLSGTLLSYLLESISSPSHISDFPLNSPSSRRIVSTVPSGTELVYALGCQEQLAGVSNFCNSPPAAAELPSIGGSFNPNLERLLALEPDVIIVQGQAPKITRFCRLHQIEMIQIRMNTLEIIFEDMLMLGERLDCRDRADRLVSDCQNRLNEIQRPHADHEPVSVFFSLSRLGGSTTGLSTVGQSSFITEVIHLAGGRNIFADIKQPYPKISRESLLKRQPEIIIEPYPGKKLSQRQRRERLRAWQTMKGIPAVATGRIYFVPENLVLMPGPRIVESTVMLAEIFHPELYDDDTPATE